MRFTTYTYTYFYIPTDKYTFLYARVLVHVKLQLRDCGYWCSAFARAYADPRRAVQWWSGLYAQTINICIRVGIRVGFRVYSCGL